MDTRHLSSRAKDIGEILRVFLSDVASAVSESHTNQDAKLSDGMDQTIARIDREQSEREAETRSHVAKQAAAVRDDVMRNGEQMMAAFEQRLESMRSEIESKSALAMSNYKREVTEAIAEGNRATHDALVERFEAKLKGSK